MVGAEMVHHRSPGIAPMAAPRVPSVGAQMMGVGVQGGAWLITWFAAARHLRAEVRKESRSEIRGKFLR